MPNICKTTGSSSKNANVCFTYGTSAASYDNGLLATMTDTVGSENYTYNNLEQITQLQKVINSTTYTLSYTYNLAGELTALTYPSGRVVQQSVDAIGRLCEVAPSTSSCGSAASPFATGFSYSAAGKITGWKYGNGIYASLGFAADRLQLSCLDYSTTNRAGTCTHDSTTKLGLSYSYPSAPSNNGLISGITDSMQPGRSATYTYDSLYRLASAATAGSTSYPAWGLSETYDRYGNRNAQSILSGCAGLTCPTFSATASTTTNRLPSPNTYDSSGNMTNDGIDTLVYDAENHVVSSANGSGSGAYTYDGNCQRVKKVGGGNTIVTVFAGARVLAEYYNGAAPSSPTNEYIYAGSVLVASVQSGTTNYWHSDHLSPRVRTNTSGSVSDERGTFPFGETWYTPGSTAQWMFTTYYRDIEANGNDYAQARTYAGRLARFSSPDPIAGSKSDPQSLNRYSYVRNMPVTLTDPSGLCLPVVQNHDTGGSQDAKSGGPFSSGSADSGVETDSWNADPQGNGAPQEGCSQGYGNFGNWAAGGFGGFSIDGGEVFSPGDGAGGLLGNSESTIPCSNSGCNLDENGNFVGSVYNPSGHFSSSCTGPWANPAANCSKPLWHSQGWQYGIVGSQFDSAYDPPIGLDIFHCPDGCGHIFTAANTTVNVATAGEVALVGGALSAPAVVTAATTAFGWGYGAYTASATGVVALGSQADTELAALEDGVSKLSVSPGTYNFLNNMGQWWTVNRAFLDANTFFGGRFTYVTDPSLVWSGSW